MMNNLNESNANNIIDKIKKPQQMFTARTWMLTSRWRDDHEYSRYGYIKTNYLKTKLTNEYAQV